MEEAFSAITAVSLMVLEISFMVALSSSMEEACSAAPWDKVWEALLTCSAPLLTSSAEVEISDTVLDKSSVISTIEFSSGLYAPW